MDKSSSVSRCGEESPKPTPYKVDTGPIPLDTLAVSPDGKGECWYRIPSWRVYFDHEALKGIDMRLHRAIASHGVWTLTEASTGLQVFADLPHEFYLGDEGAMLSEFAAGRMLQITPEKLADALAKGRAKLRQHTPNPLNAVASEKPAPIPDSIAATYTAKIERDAVIIKTLRDKLVELCDRLNWKGPGRESNIEITVREARAIVKSFDQIAAGVAFITDERLGGP